MVDSKRAAEERASKHFESLGRFITHYSSAEAILQSLLWTESGLKGNTAKALFSNVRVDAAKDLINKLRATKGSPDFPILTRAFGQLGVINRARNDIVHYGVRTQGGEIVVSNARETYLPQKLREFQVSERYKPQAPSSLSPEPSWEEEIPG